MLYMYSNTHYNFAPVLHLPGDLSFQVSSLQRFLVGNAVRSSQPCTYVHVGWMCVRVRVRVGVLYLELTLNIQVTASLTQGHGDG